MVDAVSALDDYLGPRDHDVPDLGPRPTQDEQMLRAIQGGTRWQCEDAIRPAMDAVMECWPELMPRSPKVRQSHYQACRDLVAEVGELEVGAFIRWAATVIAQENPTLTVKDTRSLMWLVGRWRLRETRPSWMVTPCKACGTIHVPGPCYEEDEDD